MQSGNTEGTALDAATKPVRRTFPHRSDEIRKRIKFVTKYRTRSLDLRCMGLTSLPKEAFGLASLEEIFLNENNLSDISPEIGRFRSLKRLHLNSNLLTSIPNELGQLHALEFLNLPNNNLCILPDCFAELQFLQHLDIRCNDIRSIPATLREIESLKTLAVEGNVELESRFGLDGCDARQILDTYFTEKPHSHFSRDSVARSLDNRAT